MPCGGTHLQSEHWGGQPMRIATGLKLAWYKHSKFQASLDYTVRATTTTPKQKQKSKPHRKLMPDRVTYSCYPRTWEVEAGGAQV